MPNFGEHTPHGFSEACRELEAKISSFDVIFPIFSTGRLFQATLSFSCVTFNFLREN